jgi:hypothetical protein
MRACLTKLSLAYIVGGCSESMSAHEINSDGHGRPSGNNPGQVTGTGTPAEDREEQRAQDSLWSLKEDAKWGKDAETQKKAIRDLARIGTPARSYLEEILAVLTPGEIKQCCQDAINSITSTQLSEMGKNAGIFRKVSLEATA